LKTLSSVDIDKKKIIRDYIDLFKVLSLSTNKRYINNKAFGVL